MLAILSDIHANLEALGAVLADMRRRRVRRFCVLGDVVGYGPNPRECIERVMGAEWALLGNHEEALLYYPDDFTDRARAALEWTRDQLNAGTQERDRNYAVWDFLAALEPETVRNGCRYVHGSPADPVREYVTPRLVRHPERLRALFGAFTERVCFCGHSHIPGVYLEDGRFASPASFGGEMRLRAVAGKRLLVNVGSVGQPRDGDPRACYVLFDGDRLVFRRVAYPLERTQEKIRRIPALPELLARRLALGR